MRRVGKTRALGRKQWVVVCLSICVGLAGCASGSTPGSTPDSSAGSDLAAPADASADSPSNDTVKETDAARDFLLADSSDAIAGDATLDTTLDVVYVDTGPGKLTLSGEITSGGVRSTGGTYTLVSQIGHGIKPQGVSAGSYSINWNSPLIPW